MLSKVATYLKIESRVPVEFLDTLPNIRSKSDSRSSVENVGSMKLDDLIEHYTK